MGPIVNRLKPPLYSKKKVKEGSQGKKEGRKEGRIEVKEGGKEGKKVVKEGSQRMKSRKQVRKEV